MEENFPKTYWGKLWNSLIESMYYDEKVVQIDRPKYRDEFIIRIDFTGNKIFALLQADNRSPNEIFFAINRYSEEEILTIQRVIESLVEEGVNTDLSQSQIRITQTLTQRGIPVLPDKEELASTCSCSRAQSVCNHHFAVLFQLSHYIDKNPLGLLELRGYRDPIFNPKPTILKRKKSLFKKKKRNNRKYYPSSVESENGIIPIIHVEILEGLQFSLKLFIENKSDPLSVPVPFSEIYETDYKSILGQSTSHVKVDLLKKLIQIGMKLPELVQLLHKRGKEEVVVDLDRMSKILIQERETLESMGIGFSLPYNLKEILQPSLGYFGNTPKTIQYLDASDLFVFDPVISLGNMEISPEEFKELSKNAGKLVYFRDRFVLMTSEIITSILSNLSATKERHSNAQCLYFAMKGRYKDKELKLDKNLTAFINKLYKPEDISLPQGLNSIMRPYQLKGFEWIYSTIQSKLGICIADDMGLGKTIQVIAVILKLKEERKLTNQVLVICPTTLLGNWLREVEKFAPSLKAKIYHGDDRHYTESIDIVITTYNLVRIREEFFANRKWTLLVVDEAQNIKNPSTYQTQSIKALKSEFRIAMTGTPIENRLTELWSIFDFLNPDFLGTLKWFRAEYAMPIESYQIEHKVEEFKKITSPFMIRRLKSDKSIIADLPDKIVKDEFCYLSKEQIVIYQKILKEDLDIIEQLQGVSRRGKVFQMINALKQICNHPSHFTKKKAYHPNLSGKSERLVSLLQNILPTGEKTILFTQYTEMAEILLDILNKHLGIQPDFFHGGLMRKEREKVISDFQKDPAKQLILISLKAGGTGLNLVEATNVIHYDLWWNPAVEDQATDRAYRIGQTKNVQVHRLITLGTFEEKINSIIQGKRALTDLTLIKGEKWITELSNEELKELFSLTGGEIG